MSRQQENMKVYLAGPEVFLPNAVSIFEQKKFLCEKHGLFGAAPFDNELDLSAATPPHQAAEIIYQANVALIDGCDAVVANITPFRGPHMDPGTAFEIGYAIADNKPVACYTQEGRILVNRIPKSGELAAHLPQDPQGYLIENFDLNENLMIKISLNNQGRKLVVHHLPVHERFVRVDGFEGALRQLLKVP